MKKSNKLLLGGFLIVLLLLSAIQITLHAKYKKGDYTVIKAGDGLPPHLMQSFPDLLFVSVRNVSAASVEFSDMARVAIGEEEGIQYVRNGDTLVITGQDGSNQQNTRDHVTFTVPYNGTLSVFNSDLSFKTDKKIVENTPAIYLQKSSALFSGIGDTLQLEHVKVVASDRSTIAFHGNTQVHKLDVQLTNSTIEYFEGNIDELSIITDSVSRIFLQSKHLLKANIKPIVPE